MSDSEKHNASSQTKEEPTAEHTKGEPIASTSSDFGLADEALEAPGAHEARTLLGLRLGFALVVLAGFTSFGYWYAAVPYEPPQKKSPFSSQRVDRTLPQDEPDGGAQLRYPTLDAPPRRQIHRPATRASRGSSSSKGKTTPRSRKSPFRGLRLFRYLPKNSFVYVYMDLRRLNRIPLLRPIAKGEQFPWVSEAAASLGIHLTGTQYLAASFDVRASSTLSVHKLHQAVNRWRSALKRPLCVVAQTKRGRGDALRLFRKTGPLNANMILGHRVYHKEKGFALVIPRSGLILATFRHPMANLLGLLVGRNSASARSSDSFTLLEKMLSEAPRPPVFAVVSRPSHRRGRTSGLRVPGGGMIHASGLTVSTDSSRFNLRWKLWLDSKKNAERFIRRAKRLLENLGRLYWARKTGLAKVIETISFKAAGKNKDVVVTEMALPHDTCKTILDHVQSH